MEEKNNSRTRIQQRPTGAFVDTRIEEAIDQDIEDGVDLMDYILVVDFDCYWPKENEKKRKLARYAFPLYDMYEDYDPYWPELGKLITIDGIDRINDRLELCIHLGEQVKHLVVGVNESITIPLGFNQNGSLVEGKVIIHFEKRKMLVGASNQKMIIHKSLINMDNQEKIFEKEIQLLNESDLPEEEDVVIFSEDDTLYTAYLISEDKDYAIIYVEDLSTEDKTRYYVPFSRYKPNIDELIYYQDGRQIKKETRIYFRR